MWPRLLNLFLLAGGCEVGLPTRVTVPHGLGDTSPPPAPTSPRWDHGDALSTRTEQRSILTGPEPTPTGLQSALEGLRSALEKLQSLPMGLRSALETLQSNSTRAADQRDHRKGPQPHGAYSPTITAYECSQALPWRGQKPPEDAVHLDILDIQPRKYYVLRHSPMTFLAARCHHTRILHLATCVGGQLQLPFRLQEDLFYQVGFAQTNRCPSAPAYSVPWNTVETVPALGHVLGHNNCTGQKLEEIPPDQDNHRLLSSLGLHGRFNRRLLVAYYEDRVSIDPVTLAEGSHGNLFDQGPLSRDPSSIPSVTAASLPRDCSWQSYSCINPDSNDQYTWTREALALRQRQSTTADRELVQGYEARAGPEGQSRLFLSSGKALFLFAPTIPYVDGLIATHLTDLYVQPASDQPGWDPKDGNYSLPPRALDLHSATATLENPSAFTYRDRGLGTHSLPDAVYHQWLSLRLQHLRTPRNGRYLPPWDPSASPTNLGDTPSRVVPLGDGVFKKVLDENEIFFTCPRIMVRLKPDGGRRCYSNPRVELEPGDLYRWRPSHQHYTPFRKPDLYVLPLARLVVSHTTQVDCSHVERLPLFRDHDGTWIQVGRRVRRLPNSTSPSGLWSRRALARLSLRSTRAPWDSSTSTFHHSSPLRPRLATWAWAALLAACALGLGLPVLNVRLYRQVSDTAHGEALMETELERELLHHPSSCCPLVPPPVGRSASSSADDLRTLLSAFPKGRRWKVFLTIIGLDLESSCLAAEANVSLGTRLASLDAALRRPIASAAPKEASLRSTSSDESDLTDALRKLHIYRIPCSLSVIPEHPAAVLESPIPRRPHSDLAGRLVHQLHAVAGLSGPHDGPRPRRDGNSAISPPCGCPVD